MKFVFVGMLLASATVSIIVFLVVSTRTPHLWESLSRTAAKTLLPALLPHQSSIQTFLNPRPLSRLRQACTHSQATRSNR